MSLIASQHFSFAELQRHPQIVVDLLERKKDAAVTAQRGGDDIANKPLRIEDRGGAGSTEWFAFTRTGKHHAGTIQMIFLVRSRARKTIGKKSRSCVLLLRSF